MKDIRISGIFYKIKKVILMASFSSSVTYSVKNLRSTAHESLTALALSLLDLIHRMETLSQQLKNCLIQHISNINFVSYKIFPVLAVI